MAKKNEGAAEAKPKKQAGVALARKGRKGAAIRQTTSICLPNPQYRLIARVWEIRTAAGKRAPSESGASRPPSMSWVIRDAITASIPALVSELPEIERAEHLAALGVRATA
jgi:hypothetical protein